MWHFVKLQIVIELELASFLKFDEYSFEFLKKSFLFKWNHC